MNQIQIYFISGVSGAGKSSTLKHLKEKLSDGKFDIRDFDERGVPDGGGQKWHDNETRYWLDIGIKNASEGKTTIICGFADPERFKKVHQPDKDLPAKLVLLHVSSDTLRKRLYGRHSTPETITEIERATGVPLDKFVEANVSYAPELRSIFEKEKATIIETDKKNPEEVAQEIMSHI